MKRWHHLLFVYMLALSFLIGWLTGAYLQLVNLFINFFWKLLPNFLGIPNRWRVVIICLPMGLIIGLLQRILGSYPLTIGQVLGQVRSQGYFHWRNWWKILINGLIILGAGADVGPEASASGLVAGMVYWSGCRYKTMIDAGKQMNRHPLWQQIRTILFSKTSQSPTPIKNYFKSPTHKRWAYVSWTFAGLLGLIIFFIMCPQEGVIGLHWPNIHWQITGSLAIIPAIIAGWAFGWLFVKLGTISELLLGHLNFPILKGILGGVLLIIGSLVSTDILFSGEFTIQKFAAQSLNFSIPFLLLLGLTKALISNAGFALGWRGGTIFPAIFSSLAISAAIAQCFHWMPQLTVTIFITVSLTTIVNSPLVIIILLSLLCPLQFLPLIILAAYGTNYSLKRWHYLHP